MADSSLLEVSNIETCYGLSQVLFGMSLAVAPGEMVTLMGRNGMGKTTTVRSIMGLTPAMTGSIRFDGREIRGLSAYQVAKLGIGLVPEGRQVFPNLTARENLMATAANRSSAAEPWTLDKVCALFPRLAERTANMANQLSGGEQQMLAIGRCLMMRPRLIILDEPTEGIMPRLVSQIRREIHRINQSGVSILLVEQNVETAIKLCPRVFLMEKGIIVHSGASHDLKSQPEIVHRYLGLSH